MHHQFRSPDGCLKMTYENFAFIYDEVMDESLYTSWLAFAKRHLVPGTKRILELACGTGALACAFAREGFDVTALDLSEEMLMVASSKAAADDVEVQFVQGDMLDLSEAGTYEAITCFSDSLCYMPDRQSVQQVFDTVYSALEEEGIFMFDVHSLHQINEGFREYSYHYQTEDFAFLWDSFPGEKKDSVEHFLTFFVRDNNKFLRFDELHKERTYSLENYYTLLENANFSQISIYGDFSDNKPNEQTARWFFVCKK